MTFLFADGFDLYGTAANFYLGPNANWNAGGSPGVIGAASTRFGVGQCVGFGNTNSITKTNWQSGNSASTIYFTVAHTVTATGGLGEILFYDTSTVQFRIDFDVTNNQILFYRGNGTTLIATFPSAGLAVNTWHGWQFMIVISATVGEFHIRKDGATSDTFDATGLNNLTTANARVNGIQLYSTASSTYYDDLYVCNSSGSTENTWPGDLRCYSALPTGAGSNTQFTPLAFPATQSNTGNNQAVAANTCLWNNGLTMPTVVNGPITSTFIHLPTGFTGNIRMAIYNASATVLLATSNAVANPAAGTVTFTYPTPYVPAVGVILYFAVLSDTAYTIEASGTGGTWHSIAATYPNFPANQTGSASGQINWTSGYTMTPYNWTEVKEMPQDGDTSVVYDSNVGDIDSYVQGGFGGATPLSIRHLQLRTLSRKTDTGSRSAQAYLKSGATSALGTSQALSSSYGTQYDGFPVDPNTGAQWTVAAVNAAEIGLKVSA